MVRAQGLYCPGPGFNPWSGQPASHAAGPKNKNKTKKPVNPEFLEQNVVIYNLRCSYVLNSNKLEHNQNTLFNVIKLPVLKEKLYSSF